jgi:hypothetical protein
MALDVPRVGLRLTAVTSPACEVSRLRQRARMSMNLGPSNRAQDLVRAAQSGPPRKSNVCDLRLDAQFSADPYPGADQNSRRRSCVS